MYGVIGRVKLKRGREEEALSMIREKGAAMLNRMTGSAGGYWARSLQQEDDVIQHSFWRFDTEENAGRGDDVQHAPRSSRCARDLDERRSL
jgi:hypothetical protein